MRCPYCKSPVQNGTPECPRCKMALDKVTKLFGVVPRLVGGISDEAGILSEAEKRRIQARSNELAIRYPQTLFSVVTTDLPPDSSLGVYAFWIFNEAGIAREFDRGSNNHDILLTLAPSSGRANLTVGYGLENYISEEHLTGVISMATAALHEGEFAQAIEEIIEAMSDALNEIVTNLESTHGLAPIVTTKTTNAEVAPSDF